MSMTREERKAKAYLQRLLRTNGYPTYAKILDRFDVNYTSDPGAIAYMVPNEGKIVINRGLDSRQASVTVRHEILHEYLKHEKRLLDHLAKRKGIDRSALEDAALKDLDNELKKQLYSSDVFNYAADYEISNRGYTEKDKDDIRSIIFNGRVVSGLVTEDDHPDWVEMSVEEMYDALEKERKEAEKAALDTPIKGFMSPDGNFFVDPVKGVMYGKV